MGEALPAEAGDAPVKKRPHRIRVPTSLVVTLVGIALTAWLLPAFTRQWDDRQKAQELETSLVTEMTAATAAALVNSRDALTDSVAGAAQLESVNAAWQLASIQIEEKFRAYFFGTGITDTWHNFGSAVSYTLARLMFRDIEAHSLYPAVQQTFAALNRKRAKDYITSIGYVSDRRRDVFARSLEYTAIQRELLTMEEKIAVRVLDAHPSGYSTTRGDLLQDLIP